MKTITELRNQLCNTFVGLQAGTVDVKAAKEINNAAGKIVATAKVQLEYATLRGVKPNVPFLK